MDLVQWRDLQGENILANQHYYYYYYYCIIQERFWVINFNNFWVTAYELNVKEKKRKNNEKSE